MPALPVLPRILFVYAEHPSYSTFTLRAVYWDVTPRSYGHNFESAQLPAESSPTKPTRADAGRGESARYGRARQSV
jgi:hypothetical protein